MQHVWGWLMLVSVAYACATGHTGAADALLSAGDAAVVLTMTLLATMTLWSGLMEILAACGDLKRLGWVMRRVLSPLFCGVQDEACWSSISMNLTANLLGLGNAATPSGIRAAELLQERESGGTDALATLLVLNNAGLQLMPTTVISLRHAAGSAEAGSIWLPSLAAAAASAIVGLLTLSLLRRRRIER